MPALRTCRDPGAVGAATVHVSYTARTSSHIMAAAVIKGSPVGWMGALPGTPGGQLWGKGTIEPPSHGSPAIQSRFEVPRSKECPVVTQRRPPARFDSRGSRRPTRHHSPGLSSGSGGARLDLSQKGDLPSSGERIFIWSKVANARIYWHGVARSRSCWTAFSSLR